MPTPTKGNFTPNSLTEIPPGGCIISTTPLFSLNLTVYNSIDMEKHDKLRPSHTNKQF